MAAPMTHTAVVSLAAGAGARPFTPRPPMATPVLAPRRRALVVRAAQNKDKLMVGRLREAFRFLGPEPERINGRLAMVGFVSALAVELTRGDGLLAQVGSDAGLAWFMRAVVVLTVASLVPLLRGESPEDRSHGIMTAEAEIWNGRLAMVGLVALAYTEFMTGMPFISINV